MIVDLFAGPGGWSEGLRQLGLSDVGMELDRWACATRAAAGHTTIRADLSAYPVEAFAGRVEGLIASPPCQDFSRAGKRAGINGPSGRLVTEVMRWACALRPMWIACEQVPDVLPIWREYAWRLQQLGYSTWAGLLNAADYGVPQTRQRAFLLAHRERIAAPPEPTHCRGGCEAGLLVPELLPWMSMAEALGWGMNARPSTPVLCSASTPLIGGSGSLAILRNEQHAGRWVPGSDRPAKTIAGNRSPHWAYPGNETTGWTLHTNRDQRPNGDRQTVAVDRPAPTLTAKAGTQPWVFVNGNQPRAARRGPHEPAPTIAFGHNAERVEWCYREPSPTIVSGSNRSSTELPNGSPGGSVRVSIVEAAILQGFRPDYPWQGTKTAQFSQVGNAVPPPLAAAVVGALIGRAA